jgi:hypothetical protein
VGRGTKQAATANWGRPSGSGLGSGRAWKWAEEAVPSGLHGPDVVPSVFFILTLLKSFFFYKWSFGEIIFISETNVRRQPSVKQF